jgi:hypothetical protein
MKEDCPMYPAKAADVRPVTRSLSDDVDALVEELDDARRANFAGGTHGAPHGSPLLIRAVQHKLAALFGKRRGWQLSASGFPPAVLERGVSARATDPAEGWTRAAANHPVFYRAADRRAAAVAAHLYAAKDQDRVAIRIWAAAHRLTVTFPTNFPSWWIPGGMTLCVYEPLLEAKVGRHD